MAWIKRTKNDVKSKTRFSFGNKTKSGKNAKSGTVVEFKDGKKTTLLTPSGKGTKYAQEQRTGIAHTNDMEPKVGDDGIPKRLTREQSAYRGGYLDCLKDCAKAHNAKQAARKNRNKNNGG